MGKHSKYFISFQIILVMIIVLLMGVAISHSVRVAYPNQNKSIALIRRTHLQKKVLNRLGVKDAGRARISYNRQTHVLRFEVLNMWSVPAFKGEKVRNQTSDFQSETGTKNVKPQLIISKSAKRRRAIQLRENKLQIKEDKKEAQQAAEKHNEKQSQKNEDKQLDKKIKAIVEKRNRSAIKSNHKHSKKHASREHKRSNHRKSHRRKVNHRKNRSRHGNHKSRHHSHKRK